MSWQPKRPAGQHNDWSGAPAVHSHTQHDNLQQLSININLSELFIVNPCWWEVHVNKPLILILNRCYIKSWSKILYWITYYHGPQIFLGLLPLLSENSLVYPHCMVYQWLDLPFLTIVPLMQKQELRWLTIAIFHNHWSLSIIINHYWPSLIIIEHYRSLLTIILHCWSLLTIIDHYWLIINDHHWSLHYTDFCPWFDRLFFPRPQAEHAEPGPRQCSWSQGRKGGTEWLRG